MVSTKQYIKNVNKAVKEGRHNRPIRIIVTKTKPTVGRTKVRLQGVASQNAFKNFDRISLWEGLAKNKREADEKSRIASKKFGRNVRVATRERILRHELWHIARPEASEKEVRFKLEKKTLPKKLPPRRRFK